MSWVALTKVVVRFAPLQRTTEPPKLLPFTVSVKAPPPAAALLGATVVNVGVEAPVIVKVRALEIAPPGFCTVTEALPAAAVSAAGIAAVSWVALTKVVVRFAAFQRTTEPLTKLLPFTVSVKAAPPAAALLGATVVNVGVEAPVIVKVRALEIAPPGFCTVTEAVPAAAMSAAGIAAVSWVALTKVVVRFAPFQRTTEPLTKLLPFTVSVKAAPPAAALLGATVVNVGVEAPVIVKVRALEIAPPGFCTVTEAVPAAAMSAAGIAAVSWVALTKVVVRFAPFQRTTEPLTKLLPFTVSVKAAPPAAALLGETVVNVGVEAPVIVKVRALEIAPPGFCTVTEAVPAAAMSVAGIAAVSWVALTKVVVRFAPFQRTTEPLTKLLPFTVSVKAAPPARALLGESVVNVGAAGLLNGESTEPGITSLGAEVDSPGLAHPTARLSPPPASFCNAST